VKQNLHNLKIYLIFTPLLFASVALLVLGAIFLQGYDVGNAMPLIKDDQSTAIDPGKVPNIGMVEIADTSKLPTKLPAVPTPAKQMTTRTMSMRHKEESTPQPARPLQPVAEAATTATTPVNDAVHQAIQQSQTPPPDPQLQTPPAPDPNAPINPIPDPTLPPIAGQ
jgi:hypothetical protein